MTFKLNNVKFNVTINVSASIGNFESTNKRNRSYSENDTNNTIDMKKGEDITVSANIDLNTSIDELICDDADIKKMFDNIGNMVKDEVTKQMSDQMTEAPSEESVEEPSEEPSEDSSDNLVDNEVAAIENEIKKLEKDRDEVDDAIQNQAMSDEELEDSYALMETLGDDIKELKLKLAELTWGTLYDYK